MAMRKRVAIFSGKQSIKAHQIPTGRSKMKPYINHCADVLERLDEKVDSINRNSFYKERKRPVQNKA